MSSETIVYDEEYYFDKAFHENYSVSLWFKLGGLLLSGKNAGPIIIPAAYFISAPTLFGLLLATAVKTIDTDMEISSEAIHFCSFLVIEATFPIVFNLKKNTVIHLFSIMGKGFYDYQNTLDKECLEVIAQTKEKAQRKKKIIAKLFIPVVMCACFAITILRPLMKYAMGEHHLGTPDDGLERLAPVPIWTPFGKGKWYVTTFIFITENVIAYTTPGIVFGCTLFIVCTCEDLGAQLIILGHTLKAVTRRAESLDMPREEAIRLCFKHSIMHHQILLKFIKSLETVLFIPGFVLLFGSTIMMCMSGFIFVSKDVSLVSKVVFCLFLLSELSIIFIFCWYGEYIQETSVIICDMVYSSDWVNDLKTMKSYILIIQLRSMRPIKLNFGGFLVASLETYGNILSSAFSYFNLMLAVN